MSALYQPIRGEFVTDRDTTALIFNLSCGPAFLRFALTEQDADRLILPDLLLDDWGHEINTLKLYGWIRDNGLLFPRAEVFGFDLQGGDRQYFLRDLDLMARYPCFGYTGPDSPLSDGLRIDHVVLIGPQEVEPESLSAPENIPWPMKNAALSWWRTSIENAPSFAKMLVHADGDVTTESDSAQTFTD